MNQLHFKIQGQGEPVMILHGLFGMLDNWKSFANRLSETHMVISVDLRNHGRSFHSDKHSTKLMADDIIRLMDTQGWNQVHLLGHSMGGKTAMLSALENENRIASLIVIDIAPKAYGGGHEHIIQSLNDLEISTFETRKEAQDKLMLTLKDAGVVQFLLKNLKRKKLGGFEWKFNLSSLTKHYQDIIAEIDSDYTFSKLTTFVKGGASAYILDGDESLIERFFPNSVIKTVLGAGHWIHADKPEELLKITRDHLTQV